LYNSLIPQSTVVLEKVTIPQLDKFAPATSNGNECFGPIFKAKHHHLSEFIQFASYHADV